MIVPPFYIVENNETLHKNLIIFCRFSKIFRIFLVFHFSLLKATKEWLQTVSHTKKTFSILQILRLNGFLYNGHINILHNIYQIFPSFPLSFFYFWCFFQAGNASSKIMKSECRKIKNLIKIKNNYPAFPDFFEFSTQNFECFYFEKLFRNEIAYKTI